MKLTKGMKKALSLLLSAAMVVTGVNVTANTASAEETGYTITLKATTSTDTETKDADGNLNNDDASIDGITTKQFYAKDGWGQPIGTYAIFSDDDVTAIKAYEKPVLEVVSVTEGKQAWLYNLDDTVDWTKPVNNGTELKDGVKVDLTDKDGIKSNFGIFAVSGATVEVKIYDDKTADNTPAPTDDPDATPETTPETTSTPEPTPVQDENEAFLMFASDDWSFSNMNPVKAGGNGTDATITGNGTYTVSVKGAADGVSVFCVDIRHFCTTQKFDASNAAITDVKIEADGKEIKSDLTKMYEGNIEADNDNYRLEIRNAYGYKNDVDGVLHTGEAFDEMNPDFSFSESLSVTFTIKGIKEGKTPENVFLTPAKDEDGNPVLDEDGNQKYEGVVAVGGERAKAIPADPTPVPTAKTPAKTTTGSQITTKPAITTPAAVGTAKITPAQKTVVVAPGKSVKVKFTTKAAKPATKAAVVTATTASKKVATVKVNGKKVTIKAPKKAVKGASTTVTLKSTNGDKKVSAKIKVYVRNSAKKVKAAKKAITVKKGKTTKLVIKASKVQNKKKAFADTISVKGKILKLTNVKYAKGKATLTLKGAKKAKKKAVTIKVGKKSVKVKATVK